MADSVLLSHVLFPNGAVGHVGRLHEIPKSSRPEVRCPHCRELVIPKLGPELAFHAAHYEGSSCAFSSTSRKASKESLEHHEAKYELAQALRDWRHPRALVLELRCSTCGQRRITRLRKGGGWTAVEVEKNVGGARLDVALFDGPDLVADVEVFATHSHDLERAARLGPSVHFVEVSAEVAIAWARAYDPTQERPRALTIRKSSRLGACSCRTKRDWVEQLPAEMRYRRVEVRGASDVGGPVRRDSTATATLVRSPDGVVRIRFRLPAFSSSEGGSIRYVQREREFEPPASMDEARQESKRLWDSAVAEAATTHMLSGWVKSAAELPPIRQAAPRSTSRSPVEDVPGVASHFRVPTSRSSYSNWVVVEAGDYIGMPLCPARMAKILRVEATLRANPEQLRALVADHVGMPPDRIGVGRYFRSRVKFLGLPEAELELWVGALRSRGLLKE